MTPLKEKKKFLKKNLFKPKGYLTFNMSLSTERQSKESFFAQIEQVLKELNYRITKNDGQYIVAYGVHTWDKAKDMPCQVEDKRYLALNYDTDHIHFGIREDWDTRYVYNGTINSVDDIRWIERMTNSNVYYTPAAVKNS